MTLDEYLGRDEAMSLTALSELVGVSKGRISQLRKASDCPPHIALAIEAHTGGAVSADLISSAVAAARKPQGIAA